MSPEDLAAVEAFWAEARPGGDYTRAPLSDDYLFVGPAMTLRGRVAHRGLVDTLTAFCFPSPARILDRFTAERWATTVIDWRPHGVPDGLTLTSTQLVRNGLLHEEYWAYDPRLLPAGSLDGLAPLVGSLGGTTGLP